MCKIVKEIVRVVTSKVILFTPVVLTGGMVLDGMLIYGVMDWLMGCRSVSSGAHWDLYLDLLIL